MPHLMSTTLPILETLASTRKWKYLKYLKTTTAITKSGDEP